MIKDQYKTNPLFIHEVRRVPGVLEATTVQFKNDNCCCLELKSVKFGEK